MRTSVGIDRAFAVRVVIAAGIARDFRAFDAARVRPEVQVVHGHQNAALRRFEPVAGVGKRPADDDAHGVRQVAVPHLILDVQQLEYVRSLPLPSVDNCKTPCSKKTQETRLPREKTGLVGELKS